MGILDKIKVNEGSNNIITPSNVLEDSQSQQSYNEIGIPINNKKDISSITNNLFSSLSNQYYDVNEEITDENDKIKNYSKYGVIPNAIDDVEQLDKEKAKNQSWIEQSLKSIGQIIGVEGLIGIPLAFSDLIESTFTQPGIYKGTADYTNPVSEALRKAQDWGREQLEIYRENPNKSWDVSDFGWWADNFVTVGSTLTLMAPSMGVGTLTGKLLKLNKVSRAGIKALNTINKISKSSKDASRLLKAGRTYERIASGVSTAASSWVSRNVENFQEARDGYESAKKDIINELGEYTDEEKQKFYELNPQYAGMSDEDVATDIAGKVGSDIYKRDMWLLAFDFAQFNALKKVIKAPLKIGTTGRILQKNAIKRLAGFPVEEEIKLNMLNKAKESISYAFKHPVDVIKSIPFTEGVEEGWQGISQALGEDYYKAIINPEYSKRNIQSLLTDGSIWEQAFWGVVGGLAFEKIGSGVGSATEAIKKKRLQNKQKLNGSNQEKVKLGEEKIVSNDIESKFGLINNFIKEYKQVSEGKSIDENNTEPLTTTEIQIEQQRLIDEFITNFVLQGTNNGTLDFTMELLNNESLNKYMRQQGLDEVQANNIINEELNKKVQLAKERYESALDLVYNALDTVDVDAMKLVASDITRRQFRIDTFNEQNKELDKQIEILANESNYSNEDLLNLRLLAEVETIKYAKKENQKEFNYHKEQYEKGEISHQAYEKYKEEYERNTTFLNNELKWRLYSRNADLELYNIEKQIQDTITDRINEIDNTSEYSKYNDLYNTLLEDSRLSLYKYFTNKVETINNEELKRIITQQAANNILLRMEEKDIPQNTDELIDLYRDKLIGIDKFTDDILFAAYEKVFKYIDEAEDPREAYLNLMSNNVDDKLKNALDKLKLGYSQTSLLFRALQEKVNDRLKQLEKEKIEFNTVRRNNEIINQPQAEEVNNASEQLNNDSENIEDSQPIPSTGELTPEEAFAKEEAEKEKNAQTISKEEDAYLRQQSLEFEDSFNFCEFINGHINKKDFIDAIKEIKNVDISDPNYASVFNAIVRELIELRGYDEVRAAEIANKNISDVLFYLAHSSRVNPSRKQQYGFLGKQLANRIAIKKTEDMFSATPLIEQNDEQKEALLGLLNDFVLAYFEKYGVSNNTIDVDAFFNNLINDEEIDFDTVRTIFLNFDKIINNPNINVINDEQYKQNLNDITNYFSILKELKSQKENISSYMHINAPTKIENQKEYDEARDIAIKGGKVIISKGEGINQDSISIKVKISNGKEVEIGYLGFVKPINFTNTGFRLIQEKITVRPIVYKEDGEISSDFDNLFLALGERNESGELKYSKLIETLSSLQYKKDINYNELARTLLDLLTQFKDNGRYFYADLVNKLNQDINSDNFKNTKVLSEYINSVIFQNDIIYKPYEDYITSYINWMTKVYYNYEATYNIQQRLADKSNKNSILEGKLKSLGTIQLVYRENENYNANTVPLNSTDNPLIGFSKTGEVLTETGKEKFNPITIFKKGEIGFLIKNINGHPLIAKIRETNTLENNKKLFNLVDKELNQILSDFQNNKQSLNNTFENLRDLIGNNPMFDGYDVIKSKNAILIVRKTNKTKLNSDEITQYTIATLFDNNKENEVLRTVIFYTKDNKKFISDVDGHEVSYSIHNPDYIDFGSKYLLKNLKFYPSYIGFNSKGKGKYGTNKYFYKDNDKYYVNIGGEKIEYDSYFDFAIKENLFKINVEYNKENGSFDFSDKLDKISDIYIDVNSIIEPSTTVNVGGIEIEVEEAIKEIEEGTLRKSVDLRSTLRKLGYDEKLIDLFLNDNNFINRKLLSSKIYFDKKNSEKVYARYNPNTSKIFVTPMLLKEMRKNPHIFLQKLIHENLHRQLNELDAFEKSYTIEELIDTYDQFRAQLAKDVQSGNKVAISILEWINNNNFNKDNQFIKDDKNNRKFAEEWLVESITNPVLTEYLNTIQYNGTIEETQNETLLQKILNILSRIFSSIANINKNSILAKQIEIFGDRQIKETKTPTIIEQKENGESIIKPEEEIEQISSPVEGISQQEQDQQNQNADITFIEENNDDFDIELDEENPYEDDFSKVPTIGNVLEFKLNNFKDNPDINPNMFHSVSDMDKFIFSYPIEMQPIIRQKINDNEIKFICQ